MRKYVLIKLLEENWCCSLVFFPLLSNIKLLLVHVTNYMNMSWMRKISSNSIDYNNTVSLTFARILAYKWIFAENDLFLNL